MSYELSTTSQGMSYELSNHFAGHELRATVARTPRPQSRAKPRHSWIPWDDGRSRSHMTEATTYPQLGFRTPAKGRPNVLILERIAPFSVEMVYSLAYWWQARSSCTVSVVNIWPADTYGALPPSIDLGDFDAVVVLPRLGYDPVTLEFLDRRLPVSFRQFEGLKVLMRQDENLMTSRIEDFLISNEFDVLLTCVPQDQIDVAYPRLAQAGITTRTVLTGYVTPDMRSFARAPYEARDIDLSYRAYRGTFSNGELVHEKYLIGARALEHFVDSGLTLDISLDPADRLIGKDWQNHLNNSKAVLGTESGTNLFDFDGSIYRWAQLFEHEHRNSELSYEQLYQLARVVLSGAEGNVRYSQISPRHLEAAAFGTLQVLFPGDYSGIFKPDLHYLPLHRDFSNRDQIAEAIKDARTYQRITTQAFEEIIMNEDLWIETLLSQLDALVEDAAHTPHRNRGRAVRSDPSPTGCTFANGDLLHLVTEAKTLKPLPYYFEDSLGAAGGHCVRVVLDAGADPLPRDTETVSWIGLSLHRWTPSRHQVASCPDRLTQALTTVEYASELTHPQVESELGGYSDNHGTVGDFQADCRRALRTVRAVSEWLDGGLHPGATIASDPMALPAAALVASALGIDLYVDFDGIARVLARMHGWQAKFWQDLMVALLIDRDRCRVVASAAEPASRARGLLGLEPHLLRPGPEDGSHCWEFVTSRSTTAERLDSETRTRQLESFVHPNVRTLVPSCETLAQEVLPSVERSFGLESARYWGVVRDAVGTFRNHGDEGSATALLLIALDRYTETRRDCHAPALVERLDRWRALVLNLLVQHDGELGFTVIQAISERIERGDIPITPENRRNAWRVAVQLRTYGDTTRFEQLYGRLMATERRDDPTCVGADVFGLMNLLAHHWVRGQHPEAAPFAEALLAVHHRPEDLGGVRLDENVLARIHAIQASTAPVDLPSADPVPADRPAEVKSRRRTLVRSAASIRRRVRRV